MLKCHPVLWCDDIILVQTVCNLFVKVFLEVSSSTLKPWHFLESKIASKCRTKPNIQIGTQVISSDPLL